MEGIERKEFHRRQQDRSWSLPGGKLFFCHFFLKKKSYIFIKPEEKYRVIWYTVKDEFSNHGIL